MAVIFNTLHWTKAGHAVRLAPASSRNTLAVSIDSGPPKQKMQHLCTPGGLGLASL